MDVILQGLVDEILQRFHDLPSEHSRLLVGIAGGPGSGKSTLAYPLVNLINAELEKQAPDGVIIHAQNQVAHPGPRGFGETARCIGMDGWHLTRAQLDAMSNAEEARFRRGAPFTFDAAGYLGFIKHLRSNTSGPLPFPTFEHSIKDPVLSDQPILPHQRIIIIEGLYVLLDEDIWRDAAQALDFKIFVDIERERAQQRLITRNFAAGLTTTVEETIHRVDASDMLNGDLVRSRMVYPDRFIQCVEDPRYSQIV